MHVRPYLPALLLLVAGFGALRYRRASSTAEAPPALAVTAAVTAIPIELGSGRPESDAAPRTVHGGPARRHRAVGHGPNAARVLWERQVGGAVAAQITVSADGATLYAVTLTGDLVALSAANGEERWRRAQGNRVYSAPLVASSGLLVFGRDGGAVVAVGADGTPKWHFETEADCDVAVVEVEGGGFVTACGRQIVSLRRDGTLRAEARLPKKVFSTPAATADRIVLGAQDGHVRALSLPMLLPLWDTALGADVDGGVVLADDGSVFVGTDAGEVVRLDPEGALAWRTRIGHFVRGALSVARNGDVLAGAMGPEPALVRLRGGNGEVRFRASTRGTGANEFGIRGGALEDDAGRLYFGAQDDAAYALDASGALLFRYETKGDVDAPLTLLPNGSLVIAADDGTVTCLAP